MIISLSFSRTTRAIPFQQKLARALSSIVSRSVRTIQYSLRVAGGLNLADVVFPLTPIHFDWQPHAAPSRDVTFASLALTRNWPISSRHALQKDFPRTRGVFQLGTRSPHYASALPHERPNYTLHFLTQDTIQQSLVTHQMHQFQANT